eukprot:TRINITY_DN47287_c0_g1_i1.p2 TRINITY_DN47287_c0_g1~~TRINITY_DN47287_c0_g1_i1.p2  ORF type:complete len:182 (+),score=26.55 TRINITY_DN47287_c0_g1_i1:698-1243(+)
MMRSLCRHCKSLANMVVKLTGELDDAAAKTLSDYYQDIDHLVSYPFDVVSGIKYEAREIEKAGNNFFVYSVFLHHLRQHGTKMEFLNDIDQKRMTNRQAMMLVEHLLMIDEPSGLSDFFQLPQEFCESAETKLSNHLLEKVQDPLDNEMKPVIDIAKLKEFLDVNHKLLHLNDAGNGKEGG